MSTAKTMDIKQEGDSYPNVPIKMEYTHLESEEKIKFGDEQQVTEVPGNLYDIKIETDILDEFKYENCDILEYTIPEIKKEAKQEVKTEKELQLFKNEHFTSHSSVSSTIRKFQKNRKTPNKGKLKNKTLYPCLICQKNFATPLLRKTHFALHFKQDCVICRFCGEIFSQPEIYGIHYFSHYLKIRKITSPSSNISLKRYTSVNFNTDSQFFECEICSKAFIQQIDLKMHMSQHTQERQFNCEMSSKNMSVSSDLKVNVQKYLNYTSVKQVNYIDEYQIKCEVCLKSFKHNKNLKRHMRSCHTEKQFMCEICLKFFAHRFLLKKHMCCHTDENPFQCEICLKCFAQKEDLATHVCIEKYRPSGVKQFNHVDEVKLKCEFCSKSFKRNYLKKHIKNCHTEKRFKCDICFKFFAHRFRLQKHMRSHTGEKPFKCNICLRDFGQSDDLSIHMRIHTGEKPYKCKICLKEFRQTGALTTHMRCHTGEKPFKCETCSKSFITNSSLKLHIMSHTGEKPYTCEVCFKGFINNSRLKTHMYGHTGEEPFRCEICSQGCRDKNALTRHMRCHTGEKPFKCEICLKCFKTKSDLKSHMRSHSR